MNQSLRDVTVIDVSRYVPGGFATTMLASEGADVIKVESPHGGDPLRDLGPPWTDGDATYFLTVNYGKRSVAVDLRTDAGREIVRDLAADADVFVENFRPGKADALGLGANDLRASNPELVYCSMSAFNASGPYAGRPGYDMLLQGMTGVMDVTGQYDGPPAKVGVPIVDLVSAMWAAFGITTALHRRSHTGEGDHVDLAMYDAMLSWLTKQAGAVYEGDTPMRMGSRDPLIAPYQAYEAADGQLVVCAPTDSHWRSFCEALDRPELLEDDRFVTNEARVANVDALEAEVESTMRERDVQEWLDALVDEHGIAAGPVRSVRDVVEEERARPDGQVVDLPHESLGAYPAVASPLHYETGENGFDRHAPVLGDATVEVLHEHGYSDEDVVTLLADEVIADPNQD